MGHENLNDENSSMSSGFSEDLTEESGSDQDCQTDISFSDHIEIPRLPSSSQYMNGKVRGGSDYHQIFQEIFSLLKRENNG